MTEEKINKLASLYVGRRAVGGRISTTGEELVFTPNGLEVLLSGRSAKVRLVEIKRISLTKRGWLTPRRHLLVESYDDERMRFLVNGAADLGEAVGRAASSAGGTPSVDI